MKIMFICNFCAKKLISIFIRDITPMLQTPINQQEPYVPGQPPPPSWMSGSSSSLAASMRGLFTSSQLFVYFRSAVCLLPVSWLFSSSQLTHFWSAICLLPVSYLFTSGQLMHFRFNRKSADSFPVSQEVSWCTSSKVGEDIMLELLL